MRPWPIHIAPVVVVFVLTVLVVVAVGPFHGGVQAGTTPDNPAKETPTALTLDSTVQFALKDVILGTFGLFVVAVGAGWTLGYFMRNERMTYLDGLVKSYQESEKLNLPQVLEEIGTAAKTLSGHLSTLQSSEQLQTRNRELVEDLSAKERNIQALNTEHEKIRQELAKNEAYIKSLYPEDESFSIVEGASQSLAGVELVIGVREIRSTEVLVVINSKEERLHAGSFHDVIVREQRYRVILETFQSSSTGPGPKKANFRVVKNGASPAASPLRS